MAFAENTGKDKQPYKYNGKELDTMHGLNLYDYSARYYESAIGRFTSVDPHAENYYSWSPYVYVGNNPITRTDPTGMDWFTNNENGNIVFIRGVSDLKSLDEDQLKKYGLGDIDLYENLGADDMFGDNVSWNDSGNILDRDFFDLNESSESFMKAQGYDVMDKMHIQELKIHDRAASETKSGGIKSATSTHLYVQKQQRTYRKPQDVPLKIINREKEFTGNRHTSTLTVEEWNYILISKQGHDPRSTAEYGETRVKYQSRNILNKIKKKILN